LVRVALALAPPVSRETASSALQRCSPELLVERLQGLGVLALFRPHHGAVPVVVGDDGDVAVLRAVGDLVHPDAVQGLEAGVVDGFGHDPDDDGGHRLPRAAKQPGDRGLVGAGRAWRPRPRSPWCGGRRDVPRALLRCEVSEPGGGERIWALLVTRLLVLSVSTKVPFVWLDEPLEHLDPRIRRIVAGTLVRAASSANLRQIFVTTYEEPLAHQLAEDNPMAELITVRQGV